jgi:hypothetical protein
MISLMSRRNVLVALSLFALACMSAGASSVEAAKGSGSGGVAETRIEGTLVAVDTVGSKVQIRRQNGTVAVVNVQAATKIERNGVRVPLSGLKVNDRAQARIATATGLTTKLESVGP